MVNGDVRRHKAARVVFIIFMICLLAVLAYDAWIIFNLHHG